MRAEPKTILSFLYHHFDLVRDLFGVQARDGMIRKEIFLSVYAKAEADVEKQLMEYKILRKVGEDYEFHTAYFNLLEFIMSEFKPLLPETIEKYHHSITRLYQKIRTGIDGDKTVLSSAMIDLGTEIRGFTELVERNTTGLLKETRALKSNLEKIDYREKVLRASRWIEEYVIPLNKILDVAHTDSVAHRLYEISQFANNRRLNFEEENIRLQFEKLYELLIYTNDELLRQSRILTNELLPLIERIRTESLILTGWIEFLKKPNKTAVPPLLKAHRSSLISKSMYINTYEYFEQFAEVDEVYLEDVSEGGEKWIFDKAAYKEKLQTALPVENFFGWCKNTLEEEYQEIEPEKLFSLMILLFEDEIRIETTPGNDFEEIRTTRSFIKVPPVKVTADGLF